MGNIQYVTDADGNKVAVQIPLDEWEAIKADLEIYDSEEEMAEILSDPALLESVRRGREQARQKEGKPLSEVEV